MKTVEVTQAKTDWNELLNRVFAGETIRITRGGVPIAKLVPLEEVEKGFEGNRSGYPRDFEGRQLGRAHHPPVINDGRRY